MERQDRGVPWPVMPSSMMANRNCSPRRPRTSISRRAMIGVLVSVFGVVILSEAESSKSRVDVLKVLVLYNVAYEDEKS